MGAGAFKYIAKIPRAGGGFRYRYPKPSRLSTAGLGTAGERIAGLDRALRRRGFKSFFTGRFLNPKTGRFE